jgi:hypothetical protein
MLEEVMGMIASNTLAFDSLFDSPIKRADKVQTGVPRPRAVKAELPLAHHVNFLNFDPKCSDTAIANISLRQRHFYLDNDNGKLDHS